MASTNTIEEKLKQLKPILIDRFHVNKIGYFGSYALGQSTPASDLDLLVEFSKPIGWEFFTLEKFLEKALDMPIDLVTSGALKERIKATILDQVRYI